jgi:hypothetical protein
MATSLSAVAGALRSWAATERAAGPADRGLDDLALSRRLADTGKLVRVADRGDAPADALMA